MSRPAADAVFQALADPTRRQLFELLAKAGELSVTDLTRQVPVSQPMVSRHLAMLRTAQLVTDRQQNREHLFSARGEGLAPLADWMSRQSQFWSDRFDALDGLLAKMDN